MDCKEFQEHVTEAVDGQLPQARMAAFLAHTGKCAACRNEFEVERLTTTMVRSRLKPMAAPPGVREAIATRLHEEEASPAGALRTGWRRLTSSLYFRPALAFVVGAVAMLLLVRDTSEQSPRQAAVFPVPGNIIDQSLLNYRAVVARELRPAVTGTEPESVQAFFRGKTEFPVLVPRMKECVLEGGGAGEYAGVKIAHVLYRHDRETVYLYQACWEEVQKGERIHVPPEVRRQLKATGWYSESRPDGFSLVLWTNGRTLCSAVARMPKEQLIACLTDGEGATAKPW